MTEMEQRLAALEQKCDRILEQLSALLAEIQALYPEVKSPDKHVKEADDTVLDYLDVCQILHISIRQLRRLQQSGDLQGFKNGRRRYYLSSEISAYLKTKSNYKNHCSYGKRKEVHAY